MPLEVVWLVTNTIGLKRSRTLPLTISGEMLKLTPDQSPGEVLSKSVKKHLHINYRGKKRLSINLSQ